MQLEAISATLRPRSAWEGCDLGTRLLQASSGRVYRCHLPVTVPLFGLYLATAQLADWLPLLLIWLSKPWIDRTILFALSRSLFGQPTSFADLWAARREVWGSQWLRTWVLLRLSASRSFKQPVVQLEGLTGRALRERLDVITGRRRGVARLMTQAFATAELSLYTSFLLVPVWLSLHTGANPWNLASWTGVGAITSAALYAITVCFVEPFYVAAGFGMYINRRVELEAWDIEQEFRRAFVA